MLKATKAKNKKSKKVFNCSKTQIKIVIFYKIAKIINKLSLNKYPLTKILAMLDWTKKIFFFLIKATNHDLSLKCL